MMILSPVLRMPIVGNIHPQLALMLSYITILLISNDSDRGSNMEYTATSYYVWPARSDGLLLFMFPTRVSLTTITLHYYSDSVRGRPRLRFYAVPNDFNVSGALTFSTPYVSVTSVLPGGEPAGRRSVRIIPNFNTKKLLMYKYSSSFMFAVSEVEFFSCNGSSK